MENDNYESDWVGLEHTTPPKTKRNRDNLRKLPSKMVFACAGIFMVNVGEKVILQNVFVHELLFAE